MKTRIFAAATAAALTLGAAVHAQQDDMAMSQGFNMLTGAVYNALRAQNFDTANINDLSLGQIAQIRSLLSQDMGTNERQRIETILEQAGE